jgi:hypothetical protein
VHLYAIAECSSGVATGHTIDNSKVIFSNRAPIGLRPFLLPYQNSSEFSS